MSVESDEGEGGEEGVWRVMREREGGSVESDEGGVSVESDEGEGGRECGE